jgi:hypothetical protein
MEKYKIVSEKLDWKKGTMVNRIGEWEEYPVTYEPEKVTIKGARFEHGRTKTVSLLFEDEVQKK